MNIFTIAKSSTSSWVSQSFRLLSLGIIPVLLCSCVPYVKYEDAVSKLQRANRVNADFEKRLRDNQIAGFDGAARLERSSARLRTVFSTMRSSPSTAVAHSAVSVGLSPALSDLQSPLPCATILTSCISRQATCEASRTRGGIQTTRNPRRRWRATLLAEMSSSC